ncbi:hypothetical protein SAMN05421821_101378 [Mucilaginibacter lappiensis]|uniref:Universal stress protein family protein n=1 Tax=Mucilaginibacter lappiensis TaxID=354630 RepID=A0ABR6PDB9_9SPHI|nr:hypothetical protein [Mucilaginibacter lappiensis]MBB6107706.1 hypothetical protein [Mucilaginibacter lappiensis]SIP99749.1 hypothetical protein SAMN05421821_101378 [Mucilaginibacter lappiensis]
MNEILLINDQSSGAVHTASFALDLAQRLNKNIVLANIVYQPKRLQFASAGGFEPANHDESLLQHLNELSHYKEGFRPIVELLDAADFTERDLINYINQRNIFMVIQPATKDTSRINIQSILNRILCPLLLIPDTFPVKALKRIMYLTDLRYCQVPIVNYLKKFTKEASASILIAHICAAGLPDLDKAYANDLFTNGISTRVQTNSMFFSHIKERDMPATVDTMVHGMQADLLVCQNNGYHFNQLLGGRCLPFLPDHVIVPLLVFPS